MINKSVIVHSQIYSCRLNILLLFVLLSEKFAYRHIENALFPVAVFISTLSYRLFKACIVREVLFKYSRNIILRHLHFFCYLRNGVTLLIQTNDLVAYAFILLCQSNQSFQSISQYRGHL